MSNVPKSAGPPPPPASGSSFLGCAFALSFALNLLGGVVVLVLCFAAFLMPKRDSIRLTEQHYAGKSSAEDKVAIITLDGVILEGLLGYAHKQIEQAAADEHVKAVVLRINSPGGSITASDDLHRRLTELRDGNSKKNRDPRPLIVSMGGMAASGGYYIAMPGTILFAERTTITGSIGVYASFLNVKELGKTYGVAMNTIKQGQIKDSGSPFGEMTAHERQVWQDMIDDAYQRFVEVVEKGRPMLVGGKLLEAVSVTPVQAGPNFLKKEEGKPKPYKRYLADGGVWTAEKALKHKLIDKIGTLDDAVQEAHDKAGLGDDYQVIKYTRPSTLLELLGVSGQSHAPPSGFVLDPACLEAGFAPRLWYLAPGAQVSGLFAAMRESQP
ncbi:MAG: S49 family peptidase [Gemmataceae bacterium]